MKLNNYIEHTLLKPDATIEELTKLFNEAKTHNFKGVCVNPVNVKLAKSQLKDTNIKIVTVVGFPLGASLSASKAFEAKQAIENGADEIDMVISIQAVKNNDFDFVQKDIEEVKKACGEKVLKVILETDLLSQDEIIKSSEAAVKANADFVKTSTGFVKNGVGAKPEDVAIMYKTVKEFGLEVKASGGIKDKQMALKLIENGATRLGTSSGVQIIS